MTMSASEGQEGWRRVLSAAARRLLGSYRFNRIYRLTSMPVEPAMPPGIRCQPLDISVPPSVVDSELERFWYGGDDAYGYGLFLDGRLAAACWFWGPRRFDDPALWTLAAHEAVLVDLLTASCCRGQGLAPLLIRHASAEMRRMGWDRLYTFMWHSNRASSQAFEKAGWTQIAWVLEIRPIGMTRTLRFYWRSFRRRDVARLADPQPAAVR